MNINMTLGEKIKSARKKRKMTQSDLAGNYITRTMLSKIENGIAKPSLETIKNIAEKLDLPISYFIDDNTSIKVTSTSKYLVIYEHLSFLKKNHEFSKAVEYFEKMIDTIDVDLDDDAYYKCLLTAATCYYYKGDSSKTFHYVDQIKNYFKNKEDYYQLSRVNQLISIVNFERKEYNLSIEHTKIAIDYYNKSYIENDTYYLEMYYTLGFSLYRLNKYSQALTVLLEGIEESKANNTLYRAGDMYMIIGNCYKNLGQHKESLTSTKKAAQCFEILENTQLKYSCERNLGITHRQLNHYEESLRHFEVALDYYIKEKNLIRQSVIYADLLILYVQFEQYDKANEIKNMIEFEYLASKDKVEYLIALSKIAFHEGHLQDSKDYLFQTEDILSELDHLIMLKSKVYKELADLYSSEEDYKNAYHYSSKATAISIKENE